uniref:CUB domain-containing protein n=1 Tax=Tetranychus urticae TaxID=32264 RepID=T1KP80_TETUR
MYFSFLFVLFFINLQVEANNSCNDECLTKTYCISSDGSGVCSTNNLVTASFQVIPVFGKYDSLQLTLQGYNVTVHDEATIKVRINPHRSRPYVYICHKSSDGQTDARLDLLTYMPITGSSSYKDGVLSCTWTLNIKGDNWPKGADVIKDSKQAITLYHNSKKVIVAQDISQLPIYHAQYLKCCNKVHGNERFLLSFDKTEKQIRYRFYYWKYSGNDMTVTLTRKDGIKLQFECFLNYDVRGFISNGNEQIAVDQQITQSTVNNAEICSWATPLVLGDSRISLDASTNVFDLQVYLGSILVYNEQDVTLNN